MRIAADRKALVTGAASGLGLEVARRLAAEGARVGLVDLDAERLQAAAGELGQDVALALQADVTSPAAIQSAVQQAEEAFGGLDTLVISAGIIHIKPLAEVSEQDWDATLDVNLKGAFLTCQAAAPALTASGRGRIVTIASDAGRRGFAWLHAYCASKFGLVGLTEVLAAELAPHVNVNCICPVGVPSTGMGEQVLAWKVDTTGNPPAEIKQQTARLNPVGRNATETDIANAALFLISEEADFLTGVILDVDGGLRLGAIPGTE
jgi:meso-butanediol dehydrogenase/(S,S)-butanediol dehydrogenase/diacetyl reductase